MPLPVHRRPVFWGIVLIAIGALLLMHKLALLPFSWWVYIWGGAAVAAMVMIVRRFRANGDGVFWWVMLFCFATYKFVRAAGILYVPSWYGFPLLLIAIGVAFAIMVAIRPREWHLAVPSIVFLVVGVSILLAEMGTLDDDTVRGMISTYWPFALILFGGALLLNWRKAKPTI